MKRTAKAMLTLALILAAGAPGTSRAEGTTPPPPLKPEIAVTPDGATEELTAQDRDVIIQTRELASEASQILERWIVSKSLTEDKLFSRLYYPVPQSDPMKYTTDYDSLADRDLLGPEEKTLGKSSTFMYAVITDINGYVPTHNQRYSLPLTGNRAVDLLQHRTKRIFGDRTGFAAARNQAPYLFQRYKRDTGETMVDISVPVFVRGKHWGCARVGYRREER